MHGSSLTSFDQTSAYPSSSEFYRAWSALIQNVRTWQALIWIVNLHFRNCGYYRTLTLLWQ